MIYKFHCENAMYPNPDLFDSWKIGGVWTNDVEDPSIITAEELLTSYSSGNNIAKLEIPLTMDEIDLDNVMCPFLSFIGTDKKLHFNSSSSLFQNFEDMNGFDNNIHESFRRDLHDAYEYGDSIVILDMHR